MTPSLRPPRWLRRLPCCTAALALMLTHPPAQAAAAKDGPLPDPFVARDGTRITTAEQWRTLRRPELLELFREHLYGRNPVERPDGLRFARDGDDAEAFGGLATRRDVRIVYGHDAAGEKAIRLRLYLPRQTAPAGCFVLIVNRPARIVTQAETKPTEFWPAEAIVRRGYVAAAFHYEDVALDDQDRAFTSGVYAVFNPAFATGPRPGDAWGTVAAWAWGASRAVDYLKSEPALAALPVAVIGHSRGGKAALWCGAQDERVELTISNNSGSTGAALARGKRGESVALINGRFTHWFAGNYRRYDDAEDQLPVDQHLLIALAAPRLVYVASATEDAWADPAAEFRACVEASPVWSLFGQPGLLGGATQPPPDTPRPEGRIGYHLRTGDHALTLSDWEKYLDFARRHWPRP